ncbi:MAG: hypothetical protein OHK0052_08090 [Anaerolineales bacterium]
MDKIPQNTWVEIEQIVLRPEERAANLPEDTRQTPYVLRVSGFLQHAAEVGQTVTIRTMIGRELTGTLKTVLPSYSHSFGTVVPELLTIGTEADL